MLPYGDEMITKEDFMIKCQTKIAELLKDCKKHDEMIEMAERLLKAIEMTIICNESGQTKSFIKRMSLQDEENPVEDTEENWKLLDIFMMKKTDAERERRDDTIKMLGLLKMTKRQNRISINIIRKDLEFSDLSDPLKRRAIYELLNYVN